MRPEVSIGKIIPENERGPAAAREAERRRSSSAGMQIGAELLCKSVKVFFKGVGVGFGAGPIHFELLLKPGAGCRRLNGQHPRG